MYEQQIKLHEDIGRTDNQLNDKMIRITPVRLKTYTRYTAKQ